MDGPPVVLIHGLFGWGDRSRPLFGFAPPYFPLRQLRAAWTRGPVVAVDVGAATSDHDRACEAFAQLMGVRTDYGEEHSRLCGHPRFGPDFRSAGGRRLRRWDAAHPVHLVGHSFGGNTAVALLSLLADDFWGLGTGPDWVLSITCICAPLRGCSLVYAITGSSAEKGAKLAVRRWSTSHFLTIAGGLLLRAQVKWPHLALKGLYDLRCDHWGGFPLSWKAILDSDHPYWHSGDNVAAMSTPGHNQRLAYGRLQQLSKVRLIAVMADPVEPLSPSEAIRTTVPYALASCVSLIAVWRLRRHVRMVLAAVVKRWSNLMLPSALAVILAGHCALGRKRRTALGDLCHTVLERLVPWIHAWMLRPSLRLVSYAVQKASDSLDGADRLAIRCGRAPGGNDGLIDVASQRWLDAPVHAAPRGRSRRAGMQRCSRSAGQDLSTGGAKALASCFSQADLRGESETQEQLEMGKWHVLRVPGADHALGTSFSGESREMYRAVLQLLAEISRHR